MRLRLRRRIVQSLLRKTCGFCHPLPRGRQLVTLQDAGTYIAKLPKSEYTTAEWQAVMEALILVATSAARRCLRVSASCGH